MAPKLALMAEAKKVGFTEIAERAENGEYDDDDDEDVTGDSLSAQMLNLIKNKA